MVRIFLISPRLRFVLPNQPFLLDWFSIMDVDVYSYASTPARVFWDCKCRPVTGGWHGSVSISCAIGIKNQRFLPYILQPFVNKTSLVIILYSWKLAGITTRDLANSSKRYQDLAQSAKSWSLSNFNQHIFYRTVSTIHPSQITKEEQVVTMNCKTLHHKDQLLMWEDQDAGWSIMQRVWPARCGSHGSSENRVIGVVPARFHRSFTREMKPECILEPWGKFWPPWALLERLFLMMFSCKSVDIPATRELRNEQEGHQEEKWQLPAMCSHYLFSSDGSMKEDRREDVDNERTGRRVFGQWYNVASCLKSNVLLKRDQANTGC